ncbi:hypothetical protein O3P69_014308 [Scylla paramamosain]|uniref:Uncharacterized protein n=1 Tax=Scylla paramamosain TaxID=85552 RepID=A0AAW0TBF8_SCYPA
MRWTKLRSAAVKSTPAPSSGVQLSSPPPHQAQVCSCQVHPRTKLRCAAVKSTPAPSSGVQLSSPPPHHAQVCSWA